MTRERILVTGAAGMIGRSIVPLLREHFALRLLDVRRVRPHGDDEVVRKDIRDSRGLLKACTGVSAVVHLAAIPGDDDFRTRLLPINIGGTQQVFEAARQAGVRKVVLASSGQTVLGYGPAVWVTPDMPARPINTYAATKVFGEGLARYYADAHGMSMICLRIGWFHGYDGRARRPDLLRRWCSPRDLTQLIVKSIRSDVPFAVFFAVSNNPGRHWDISNAQEVVGYEPRDSAADHFRREEAGPRRGPAGRREDDVWPTRQQELLLQAGLLRGDRAAAAWNELRPSLDIDHQSGESNRLLPLVYRNLLALGIDEPEMPRLKGLYRVTWYKNQMLLHHLASVLQMFADARIETLVLKGAPLIVQYYRDAGLRPMEDFDILVPTQKAMAAVKVLKDAGWKPEWELSPADLPKGFERLRHGVRFYDGEGRKCDLHWRVMSNLLPDVRGSDDDFWQGAVSVEIAGVPTRALNAADQLLHVCVHGASFVPEGTARWAADSMVLLAAVGTNMDWNRLIAQTKKHRAVLPMRDALTYLARTLEAPVPPAVVERFLRLPTTRRERFAYRVSTRRRPTALGELPGTLAQYARISACWSLPQVVMRFPRFVRDFWEIGHIWQLPLWAVRQGMKTLRGRRHRPK